MLEVFICQLCDRKKYHQALQYAMEHDKLYGDDTRGQYACFYVGMWFYEVFPWFPGN